MSDRLRRGALASRGGIGPPKRPSGLGRPVVRRRRGIRLRVPRRPRLTIESCSCECLRIFAKSPRPPSSPRDLSQTARSAAAMTGLESKMRFGAGPAVFSVEVSTRRKVLPPKRRLGSGSSGTNSRRRIEPPLRAAEHGARPSSAEALHTQCCASAPSTAIPCARSRILGRLLVLFTEQATAGSHQLFQSSLDLEGEYTESSRPDE